MSQKSGIFRQIKFPNIIVGLFVLLSVISPSAMAVNTSNSYTEYGTFNNWDVVNVDFSPAGQKEFENYLSRKYCYGGGTVTVGNGKISINCASGGLLPSNNLPNDIQVEYSYAICHGLCAHINQKYSSGSGIGEGCHCDGENATQQIEEFNQKRQERLNNRVLRQTERQTNKSVNEINEQLDQELQNELKREQFENKMVEQSLNFADKDVANQNEELDKQQKKQIECESKDPPKAAKKNKLGLWVCVDTAETIAAREEKKKTNKILKAFWDDMDALENVFNRRVRQLQREAKTSQGA